MNLKQNSNSIENIEKTRFPSQPSGKPRFPKKETWSSMAQPFRKPRKPEENQDFQGSASRKPRKP